MVRWAPGSRERLQAAALEAFAERGFEAVTVAEIAAAAGLTERTFFRYFTDKREVIFAGQEMFQAAFVEGVEGAPAGAPAIEVIRHALRHAAEAWFPEERRRFSRARGAVIAADPSLRERESLKMRTLSAEVARALRDRGTPEPQASLAAETCVTVFHISFVQWLNENEHRPLDEIQEAMLVEMSGLVQPKRPEM